MSGAAAARVGDPIAHSHAGLGMGLGIAAGLVAGVVLVGATIATGGAALAVVAAVGGAAGLTSFGGLKGMYIGEASMGPACGQFITGAPTVLINGRQATFTAGAFATCSKESGGPIPLATGAGTVIITTGFAGRVGETLGCSAKSISAASPNVFIGGPSATDPDVTITPEVPAWAVTGLQVLGVAGALLALPYSVVTLGVAGTIGVGAAGVVGSVVGGKAMRAARGLAPESVPIGRYSPEVEATAVRTGVPPSKIQEVLDTPKPDRPLPESYVPQQRVAEHSEAFANGGSRIALRENLDKYGIGQRDGTTFISTKGDVDNMLNDAGGDPRKLEQALGLPSGQLDNSDLVRLDFTPDAMKDLGMRMPSGNEAGANDQWLPGGFLPNGQNEAVIDGAKAVADHYTSTVIGK